MSPSKAKTPESFSTEEVAEGLDASSGLPAEVPDSVHLAAEDAITAFGTMLFWGLAGVPLLAVLGVGAVLSTQNASPVLLLLSLFTLFQGRRRFGRL